LFSFAWPPVPTSRDALPTELSPHAEKPLLYQRPITVIGPCASIITFVLGSQGRRWVYFVALACVYAVWVSVVSAKDLWGEVAANWQYALTMAFGSFVAGSTPAGGGSVAFPVLTKVLHDPSVEAKAFSLMIQSVGMSMATVLILSRRIKLIPGILLWVTVGGVAGQLLGVFLPASSMVARLLFTAVAAVFGVALAINRWALKASTNEECEVRSLRRKLLMACVGLIGGYIASAVGSDINLLTFIVLTLAFGVDEKFAIPTTVVIMAVNALFWFVTHLVLQSTQGGTVLEREHVWHAWLAAVPIVAVGAPLGSWVASVVKRDALIVFLLLLIFVEVASTVVILGPKMSSEEIGIVAGMVVFSLLWFWAMHRYRKATRPADFA